MADIAGKLNFDKPPEKQTLSIYIDKNLVRILQRIKKKEKLPVSRIVEQLLSKTLKKYPDN